MHDLRRLARYLPISIGLLSLSLTVMLPSVIMKRMGLPDWPWLFVLALSFSTASTALILYGRRWMKRPPSEEP